MTIEIWDVGCGADVRIVRGKLRVRDDGGCPVRKIIGPIVPDLVKCETVEECARLILDTWCDGYDGDPKENDLFVEVTVNGQTDRYYAM